MTVNQLISKLKDLPQDATVVIGSDVDDWFYSELDKIEEHGRWNPETRELETFPFNTNECFFKKAVIFYPEP